MAQELFSLPGCTAQVTGGNGGLGWAMALGFRAAGAQVAITGRNPEKNALAIKALGNPKAVLALDVRNEEAVARTMTHVVDHFGRLDILVNNAGDVRTRAVTELSAVEWRESLRRGVGQRVRRLG